MVLASTLLPAGAKAQSAFPIRVGLDWIPSNEYAGFFEALAQRKFAAKGLDVTFTPGGPSSPLPYVSVAAGSADLGFGGWLSMVDAVNKGNEFVALGALYPKSPVGILSLPSNPIRKAADINGKRMMVQDPSFAVAFDAVLAFANIKPDYQVVPTGFSADPLFAGDGDGYMCFIYNQPLELEAKGMVRDRDFVLASLLDLGYDIPETLMVVERSFLEKNRAHLVDYLEQLIRGWNDHEANPAKTMRYIVDRYGADYGLDYDVELKQDALQSPGTKNSLNGHRFDINDSQIALMYRLLKLTGRVEPEQSKIIDLSLLREAEARIV
jgi:ABC-type nitrate/sulfonate/bicarbonate transport system substrate-binding protein